MKSLSEKIRHNEIHGPSNRRFDLTEWSNFLSNPSLSEDDKHLVFTGIYFHHLLQHIREEKDWGNISHDPETIIRTIISVGTEAYIKITKSLNLDKQIPLNTATALQQKIEWGGQMFHPDEIISHFGDGAKLIIGELINKIQNQQQKTPKEITSEDLVGIVKEIQTAQLYRAAVELWNNCVARSYRLLINANNHRLTPMNPELEIAKIATTYRRRNLEQEIILSISLFASKTSNARFSDSVKKTTVHRVYGGSHIEKIQMGLTNSRRISTIKGIIARYFVQAGIYESLADEPLPKFYGVTLSEITDFWCLLNSLATAIVDQITEPKTINRGAINHLSPTIEKNVLTSTISRTFGVSNEKALNLIKILKYTGNNDQELWSQPLIELPTGYCLVLPCICEVSFLRIAESWLRQGGIDLSRKGKVFEIYCREEFKKAQDASPIKETITIVSSQVKFTPQQSRSEEIDIVIFIGDTVLLLEAKCILSPDDSLQFDNYLRTIEYAADQITRKAQCVKENSYAFKKRLSEMGYLLPEEFRVVAGVITSSPIYSGCEINDIPITDVMIIKSYFKGYHAKTSTVGASMAMEPITTVKHYTNADEAARNVESYLRNPPQLDNIMKSIRKRDIYFPLEHSEFGQLINETYTIEFGDEIQAKIG